MPRGKRREADLIEELNTETAINNNIVKGYNKTDVMKKGIVSNCIKLNLRSNPESSAAVLDILNVGDNVDVFTDPNEMPNGYYKVITKSGIIGYVVMEYLDIR